jgi:hypothetical protein
MVSGHGWGPVRGAQPRGNGDAAGAGREQHAGADGAQLLCQLPHAAARCKLLGAGVACNAVHAGESLGAALVDAAAAAARHSRHTPVSTDLPRAHSLHVALTSSPPAPIMMLLRHPLPAAYLPSWRVSRSVKSTAPPEVALVPRDRTDQPAVHARMLALNNAFQAAAHNPPPAAVNPQPAEPVARQLSVQTHIRRCCPLDALPCVVAS